MLLAIYLRGPATSYTTLGQNLHIDDIVRDAASRRPALILLSATSEETASQLAGADGPPCYAGIAPTD